MSSQRKMKNTYVVTLKAKQGELRALREANWQNQSSIIPLFDIPKPTRKQSDAITAKNKDVYTEYLKDIAQNIRKIYTNNNPIMVDMYYWGDADIIQPSGMSVYEYFHNQLNEFSLLQIPIIPVIDTNKMDSEEYKAAMRNIASDAKLGLCIRVDMPEGEIFLDEVQLTSIIEEFNVQAKQCRIILDLGYLTGSQEGNLNTFLDIYKQLQKYKFHKIIVSGSSMPKSITQVATKQHSEGKINRIELDIWKFLVDNNCDVSFGDYGVRHPKPEPEPENSDDNKGPFFHNRNTQIRYTTSGKHIVFRGCPAKNEDNSQQKLAVKLTSSEVYDDVNFSWGDQKIHDCSKGGSPGNSSSWIAFETSRHIAFVPKEINAYLESKALADVETPFESEDTESDAQTQTSSLDKD